MLVWDTRSPLDLPAVDSVIHLAGEGIFARRWSSRQKAEIRDSRVQSTLQLGNAIRSAEMRPRSFICASALGYHGFTEDEELSESTPAGDDFLARVCQEWEAAAAEVEPLGVRVVRVRVGVVLGVDGGALEKMLFPFSLGLGGPLGGGRQWVSWVHVDDVARLFLHAIEREVGRLLDKAPNVDFGSVTLRRALALPRGSALALVGIARSAGWIAHVIEQYATDRLIRPRARYVGPAPEMEPPAL